MNHDDIMRIRDAIHVGLMVREGRIITEEVARERANNISSGLAFLLDEVIDAALREAARGVVVAGNIDPNELIAAPPIVTVASVPVEDEPPVRSRYFFDEMAEETAEQHAARVIK